MEQYYATVLLQDDKALTNDDDYLLSLPVCIIRPRESKTIYSWLILQKSLFEFMCQYYLVRNLAPISCHAFISSLTEFYHQDKVSMKTSLQFTKLLFLGVVDTRSYFIWGLGWKCFSLHAITG